jgi:hypothetical protein
MGDRKRMQTPSCGVVVVLALGLTVLSRLGSLAVERGGVIAFLPILGAMIAAAFGLVVTGWMRRKGEGMWMPLVSVSAVATGKMVQALGVPWWGALVIVTFVTIAGWLVFFRMSGSAGAS